MKTYFKHTSLAVGFALLTICPIQSRATNEQLDTDLFNAVVNQEPKKVDDLLKQGASPDATRGQGTTALMRAIRYNPAEAKKIAQLLINAGANVNAKNELGQTVLMYAAASKGPDSKEIVELLLDKGAKVNEKDGKNKTALMMAAKSGSKEIVDLLIKNKANVNARDKNKKTALDYALDYAKDPKVAEIIRKTMEKVGEGE